VPLGGLITALFVLEHGLFGPQSHRSVVNLDAQEAVEL
jgi:hypothetical protein